MLIAPRNRLRNWFGALLVSGPSVPPRLEPITAPVEPTPIEALNATCQAPAVGSTRDHPLVPAVSSRGIEPTPTCDATSVFGVEFDGRVPVSHRRSAWLGVDGQWCPGLQVHPPSVHARRLLQWLLYEQEQTLDFPTLLNEYCEMCAELEWCPHTWGKVARHFTGLSGGKRYRSAVCPRTGLRVARERVYTIPAAADLNKPVRPVARPAVKLVPPIRRAA